MYNKEALACSQSAIESQMQFTIEALPFIRQITPTNSDVAMKKDYFYDIDAVGIGVDHHNYNIQYKVRPKHTDFCLIAKKLSGVAADSNTSIGFRYKGEQYSFTPIYDYIIERIQGVDYLLSREQIHSMELLWPYELEKAISFIEEKTVSADDGTHIPTGQYYVFFPIKNIAKIQAYLLKIANPSLCFADILNECENNAKCS